MRLIIASNRLPVTVRSGDDGVSIARSPGGLATGLKGTHERSGGVWIGWPGDLSRLSAEQQREVQERLHEMRLLPIDLSPDEVRGYYGGVCNGVLWPLFHYLVDRARLDSWDFATYRYVNERFADRIVAEYRPGDLVWVHDFHLALVPALVRARVPEARIGFFLHIPFPSSEVFRILPWRDEILDGILGADLVGFHTLSYVRHFGASILRILGVEAQVDRLRFGGREIRLGVFPMGVDAAAFVRLASDPEVVAQAAAIRREAGGRRILLGIDRLDYTKGVPRRLLTIERLLKREPELASRVRLVQVAVPSRLGVEGYERFRREVHEIVGRVNAAFSTAEAVPIHFMGRSYSERDLAAMYLAADVMLVTPLRDGMNLVAKEFVATRTDDDGVLVLSEFAGAAEELGEALRVNPYDEEEVASAILQAIAMPRMERRARMRALRRNVLGHDVHRWADDFIVALERTPSGRGSPSLAEEVQALVEEVRRAERLLVFLDYDGTLVPFASEPGEARPDGALREILAALAGRRGTEVHILSGRSREDLDRWFADLPIGCHAEHGMWSRLAPGEPWTALRDVSQDWKEKVLPILESFVGRTPGSFIEEKTASIAWHYRKAEEAFGVYQARELRLHLIQVLSNLPVEVLQGSKVVEVRLHGVHKGTVVLRVLAAQGAPSTVLALGDDRTDEEMFAAIPPGGHMVHVGPNPSRAAYRLPDVREARDLLRRITR